jgi:antirestriction protein
MSEKQPTQPQQPEEPGRRDLPKADNPNEPWARQEQVGDVYSVEITDAGQIERADKLTLRPMVWIGCLAAYNNGELHGDWVDAAVEGEELVRSAQEILSRSPEPDAEEWAIFDDDEFGGYRVEQYDSLEHVARVARGIREHGHAFAAWAQLHDGDEAMLDSFEDAFLGEYESPEAWGREVLDELNLDGFLRIGAIPETIRPYLHIDYEGWARDAELGGVVYIEQAPGGGIYVFSTL